jgi:phosphoribosylanthranilate isomerase
MYPLTMPSHRTRIKICGLTREADIEDAVCAGADAVGFVFYEKSPRYVSPQRAAELAKCLPAFVTPVGLFVNSDLGAVQAALSCIPQLVLQFHGDESPADCQFYLRPYIRAARMAPSFDLLQFGSQFPDAQALLLDAHVESYGGSGKVFDWSLVPSPLRFPTILSGGLTVANVTLGIQCLRPWAVDVSSGVESAKGIKDAQKIIQFCDAVREADARWTASDA